jgi:hypothetical protein
LWLMLLLSIRGLPSVPALYSFLRTCANSGSSA